MIRLPVVNGKQAVRIFKRAGWKIARQKGSHIILMKENNWTTLSVPVHSSQILPRGTLRGLIRDAGMTVTEFAELM